MAQRILITGVAGFIGSQLGRKLLKAGFEVWGIDNFEPNYTYSLKAHNIRKLSNFEDFRFLPLDIRDKAALSEHLGDIQVHLCIHLAAKVGVAQSFSDIDAYIRSNVEGTKNILEYLQEFGCRRLIFASSSSVYGANPSPKFVEDMPLLTPLNPYASSKIMGENLTYNYHHLCGLSVLNFRFFNVYGPCGRPDMAIAKFSKKIINNTAIEIYGDGSIQRDWTYIDDITDGICAGVRHVMANETMYEVFNLGNTAPVALNTVIDLLEDTIGKKAKRIYTEAQRCDMPYNCADISKSHRILGYSPQVNLAEGLRRYIDWYHQHSELI